MWRSAMQRIRDRRASREASAWLARVCAEDDRRAAERVLDLVALERERETVGVWRHFRD